MRRRKNPLLAVDSATRLGITALHYEGLLSDAESQATYLNFFRRRYCLNAGDSLCSLLSPYVGFVN